MCQNISVEAALTTPHRYVHLRCLIFCNMHKHICIYHLVRRSGVILEILKHRPIFRTWLMLYRLFPSAVYFRTRKIEFFVRIPKLGYPWSVVNRVDWKSEKDEVSASESLYLYKKDETSSETFALAEFNRFKFSFSSFGCLPLVSK